GLRVLVCGLDRVPATFSAGGYTLAREPALLPPPDTESVARVLRELNYVQIVRRRAAALQPAFQLVLPQHRLDFGPDVTARELARRGTFRLDGGLAALRALFLDRIGTSSGEVRDKLTPVEIVQKRGRVVGLRVRPRDETIGLDHLIWSGPLSGLLQLCGDKASRKLKETAAGVRPACYRYTLCLLVRPDALPEGMGPRVIAVRDPAQPLIEDNAL